MKIMDIIRENAVRSVPNIDPDNLRLICPNCHSQTEFLGGANKGRGRGSLGIAKY